jgi:uncharacterized protein YhfF
VNAEVTALAVIVLLLAATGYLAAVETAVARTDVVRALRLREEDAPGSDALLWLVEHRGTALSALLVTTEVRIVPFDQVDEEHARREGEGDLSLAGWRVRQQEFFTDHGAVAFSADMPVVLERLEVLYEE